MSALKQLQQLKELAEKLKSQVDSDDSDDDSDDKKSKSKIDEDDEKMSSTIHLLYAASRVRIFKLADKVAGNKVTEGIQIHEAENLIEIPEAESWDFKLGDWVRIKYSINDFKEIQKRTLGWNARLRSIHGCDAIVTKRWSEYETSVTIYTPSRFSTSSIYAGVLEVIPESERNYDTTFTTKWKVGDYVTTIMDEKVVDLMQRRLDTIPQRYLGRKGRVMAVTRVAVIVTFNERTSYDINSYLLVECPDRTPLDVPERIHKDGFILGEKVKMISNIKQLVANQKNNGGWNESMTKFVGKEVRIIHICKDGKLHVQNKDGTEWLINSDSVHSLNEINKITNDEDTEFTAGDIVKIKVVNNMRSLLLKKNVPLIFLDYLRSTAEVELVDDDFDYLIRYNCDQNVSAYSHTVRQATLEERTKHIEVKEAMESIKAGSKVCFDVGPPSFVKTVLRESNFNEEIVYALTNPSTLIGFSDDKRAVIEYQDGKRYKIKKKFLTVPEKFSLHGNNIDGVNFETAQEIQEALANCVQILREDDECGVYAHNPVRILSMAFDSSPEIALRVFSLNATVEKISECLLQMYGWDVHIRLDDDYSLYVKDLTTFDREIKVSLYFNQDPFIQEPSKPTQTPTAKPKSEPNKAKEKEPSASSAKKNKEESGAGANPEQPRNNVRLENWGDQPSRYPTSLTEFHYMPLPFGKLFIPCFFDSERADSRPLAHHRQEQNRDRNEKSINISGNTENIYIGGNVTVIQKEKREDY